jgi:DNA topoisomerase-3
VPDVLAAIRSNDEALTKAVDGALPTRKSKAWNDSKVGAHHGIIPTARRADLYKLGDRERKLYGLIARQYVVQFYPDFTFASRKVSVTIEGGVFNASSKETLDEGWKAVFPRKKTDPDKEDGQRLPELKKGDQLQCKDASLLEKETQPPRAFTDATLLSAMTGIARYVKDSGIRKILKETDGLGTEATRAGIIELLFNRKYLTRQGKDIKSTETGKALINALPELVSRPDMTAQWEASLNDIVEKKGSYRNFMARLEQQLRDLLIEAGQSGTLNVQGLPPVSPRRFQKKGGTGKPRKKRTYTSKKGQASKG